MKQVTDLGEAEPFVPPHEPLVAAVHDGHADGRLRLGGLQKLLHGAHDRAPDTTSGVTWRHAEHAEMAHTCCQVPVDTACSEEGLSIRIRRLRLLQMMMVMIMMIDG